MKTKKIPALIMLLGGSVTCIVTYINHYNLEDMLIALIFSLVIFFALGLLIEFLFEKFEIAKEKEKQEEEPDGEVVDKTGEVSNESLDSEIPEEEE